MIVPWLGALALAHPLALQVVDHQTDVQVLPGQLRVRYEVTVPVHDAEQAALLQTVDQLESGLLITLDGHTLPWTRLEQERITEGHEHRARLLLTAPLPENPRALELSSGNYPFSPSVFTWRVELHRAFEVGASSLRVDTPTGPRWYDDHPLIGDDGRTLTLQLDAGLDAAGKAWMSLTPRMPRMRPVADAWSEGPLSQLGRRIPTPLGLLLGASVGLAAGSRSEPALERGDVATGLAFLGWLVLAGTALPATGPALDWLGLPLLLLFVADAVRPLPEALVRLRSPAVTAVAALATGAGTLGGAVWFAWAIGRGLPRERTPAMLLPATGIVVAVLCLTRALFFP